MGDSKSKGKEVSQGGSNPDAEQSAIASSETKLDPSQDDEGELEVISRRNKNKPGNTLDDADADLASDDYDSDVSQQSHGTRMQNKWSVEHINECQNVPGATDPSSVIPCGENDLEIVWPPMVFIMHTRLDKDKGHPELHEYYKEYPAIIACDSYGSEGLLWMSVLTFESSATGYSEANRLHMDFVQKEFDRDAWLRSGTSLTGGVHQLYGFLATKQDLDAFNKQSQGRTRLKYEMMSYQEYVVRKMQHEPNTEESDVMERKHVIPNDITSQIIQKLPLKSAARFCAVSPNWGTLITDDVTRRLWSQAFSNPRVLFTSYIETQFIDYQLEFVFDLWFHSLLQSMPFQLWNQNQVPLPGLHCQLPYICEPVRGSTICYARTGDAMICNPTWSERMSLPKVTGLKRGKTTFYLGFNQSMGIFKVLCVSSLPPKPMEFRVLSVDGNSSWRRVKSNKKWVSVDYKSAGYRGVFLEDNIYFEAGVSTIMCFDVETEDFRVITLPVQKRRNSLMKVNQKLGFIEDRGIWVLKDERWCRQYSIPSELSPPDDVFGRKYQCLGTIGNDKFVFTSTRLPLTVSHYDASKQLVENIAITDYKKEDLRATPRFFSAFLDYLESPYPETYGRSPQDMKASRLEALLAFQIASYSPDTVGSPKAVRIVVVGDKGTGKSSLIVAAASDAFPPNVPLVLTDTKLPLELFPDGVPVSIVDTSSRPEDREMVAEELRNADAVVLTYDCSRPDTLEGLSKYWLPELQRLEVKVPIIVAGCKLDLRDDNNPVSLEKVMSPIMHQFLEIETFIECSALEQLKTQEVFCYAQKRVLHPTGPLFDQESQTLKPRCVRALKRIFVLCDHDRDGALSQAEFNDFQVKCSHEPVNPSQFQGVKRAVQEKLPVGVNERGLTFAGFLFLHAFFIEKGRLEMTWTVLRKFGYNNDISLADELRPPSLFKRAPDQSVELTDVAIEFLSEMYVLFDVDGDNNLRPREIEGLFSTAPESPWTEAPYVDAAEKTALGGLSLDAFLSLWSLMTTLEPARSVEHLICIGFPGDPSSAIRLTRRRRLDRKKHQCERKVLQCFVFGPDNAGKSALLNCFLGRSYADNPGSTADERYAVNMVDESGSAKKTLVMREISEGGAKGLFSSKESLAACDIALFVYDSSDESSWKRASELLVEVATHGEATGYEVPCLMVSAKDDLDSFLISIQESTKVSQDMGIEPPVSISFKSGDFNYLFRKILTAAQHPHLSIPQSEAGKSRKRFNSLIHHSLVVSIGAAAAAVVFGLVAAKR